MQCILREHHNIGNKYARGSPFIAQVRGKYGDAEAQAIVENCGNTLILRWPARECGGTAEFASRLIGKREVIWLQTTRNRPEFFGAAGRRSEISTSPRMP